MIHRLLNRLRCERGITLIEMLVATATGTIIMLASIVLLEVVQNESSRVEARTEASQRGRAAMQQVTQRLRSQICSGDTDRGTSVFSPVKAADASSVTFYADLPTRTENDGEFKPELRRIFVSGTDLREQVWDGVGTPPIVSFPALSGEQLLLKDVRQVTDPAGTTLPYFRYYTYDNATPPQVTVELKPPLSDADMKRIVKVSIAFKPATIGTQDVRVDSDFVNSVTNRFTNPYASQTSARGPECL